MNQISQRGLKEQIVDNPNLTHEEKTRELNRLRAPYQEMSDEELLQLVRDFVKENDRLPTRKDLVYDTVLKQRFGPWGRMLYECQLESEPRARLILSHLCSFESEPPKHRSSNNPDGRSPHSYQGHRI